MLAIRMATLANRPAAREAHRISVARERCSGFLVAMDTSQAGDGIHEYAEVQKMLGLLSQPEAPAMLILCRAFCHPQQMGEGSITEVQRRLRSLKGAGTHQSGPVPLSAGVLWTRH